MKDERFDLLRRMASSLGLELTVGETDEQGDAKTVCIRPASDPEGPPADHILEIEIGISASYTWLLGYEAADQASKAN